MPARPPSLKVRALQWLALREHSRNELRGKLLRLVRATAGTDEAGAAAPAGGVASGDAADEVDALLDWLELHRYLSPDRFVESRINARQARWGNLRITRELAQHGLALDAPAARSLQESELARARIVWRKKYPQPAADAPERARQMRFLAGRGFSAEVVRRVVRGEDDEGDGG